MERKYTFEDKTNWNEVMTRARALIELREKEHAKYLIEEYERNRDRVDCYLLKEAVIDNEETDLANHIQYVIVGYTTHPEKAIRWINEKPGNISHKESWAAAGGLELPYRKYQLIEEVEISLL